MQRRGPRHDHRNSEAKGFLALNRNDDGAVPVEAPVSRDSARQTVRESPQAAKRGRPPDGMLPTVVKRVSVFYAYADFAIGADSLQTGGS